MILTKTLLVGGLFDGVGGKPSSIMSQMSTNFANIRVINGGDTKTVSTLIPSEQFDLILWMPNVPNATAKDYPKKQHPEQVLICSKRLKPGQTAVDALDRLFKMHANAVIVIEEAVGIGYEFKLVDALGNLWVHTQDLETLSVHIGNFYHWASGAKRIKSEQFKTVMDISLLDRLSRVNRLVADKAEAMGGRFFGNTSTRCSKLFPSARMNSVQMCVSKRNVSKERLTADDFVTVEYRNFHPLQYYGEDKPSIDSPVQAKLYEIFPDIDFFIHGHTYVEGAPFTTSYFPCGDMREVAEIKREIERIANKGLYAQAHTINLKNHGFLMYAETIEALEELADSVKFIKRDIGNEPV